MTISHKTLSPATPVGIQTSNFVAAQHVGKLFRNATGMLYLVVSKNNGPVLVALPSGFSPPTAYHPADIHGYPLYPADNVEVIIKND